MWNFEKYKENTAIITEDGCELTYGQLHILQQTFHDGLDGAGLVCIFCTNTVACLAAYTACIQAHIPVMLEDAGMAENQKLTLVKTFQPDYVYQPDSCGEYELLKCADRGAPPVHPELALLLSTSGTTGSPKHVRISYGNLRANTEAIIHALDIRENGRTITSMELSYSFGLSLINTYLYAGASIVMTRKKVYMPSFWRLMEDCRVTSFSGVPAAYRLFCKLGIENHALPALQVMTQAGGGMEPELWEYMEQFAGERKISFHVMYGQTEATARIACLEPDMMGRKRGSIGRAVGGGSLSLVDEQGNEITVVGEEGEIVYCGPNVSLGYAMNRSDLARGDERQGRLFTGDYGYVDRDGYWYVTGRKDRMWKLSGKRYQLDETERMLERRFGDTFRCLPMGGVLCVQGTADEKDVKQYMKEQFRIHPAQIQYQKGKADVISKNKIG